MPILRVNKKNAAEIWRRRAQGGDRPARRAYRRIFRVARWAVVKATTSANGHRPCLTSSAGPEISVVACSITGCRDLHQHSEPHHGKQHEGCSREGQAAVQGIAPGAAERRAAAHAVRPHVGAERGHDLELAAAEALAQLRAGSPAVPHTLPQGIARARHLGLQEVRDPVREIGHGVAGHFHLARHVGRGRRFGNREVARCCASRPVEFHSHLGKQHEGRPICRCPGAGY